LGIEIVTGGDPVAENTFEDPDRICTAKLEEERISAGSVGAHLPPMSATALSFRL